MGLQVGSKVPKVSQKFEKKSGNGAAEALSAGNARQTKSPYMPGCRVLTFFRVEVN